MTRTVEDIMSRELYSVRPSASVEEALAYLLIIDVTSSPVLESDGNLVGVISLRDLVRQRTGRTVRERMTSPPATILSTSLVSEAGDALARMNLHRLVVIDEAGEAVGMVSAIDVVRGLIGAPTPHPQPFAPREVAAAWTADETTAPCILRRGPSGSGELAKEDTR